MVTFIAGARVSVLSPDEGSHPEDHYREVTALVTCLCGYFFTSFCFQSNSVSKSKLCVCQNHRSGRPAFLAKTPKGTGLEKGQVGALSGAGSVRRLWQQPGWVSSTGTRPFPASAPAELGRPHCGTRDRGTEESRPWAHWGPGTPAVSVSVLGSHTWLH